MLHTYPPAGLVVVQVHQVPDVPLLPHDTPVRRVDELAGKAHPILQVVAADGQCLFTYDYSLQ
jgi:hypothetical protein